MNSTELSVMAAAAGVVTGMVASGLIKTKEEVSVAIVDVKAALSG